MIVSRIFRPTLRYLGISDFWPINLDPITTSNSFFRIGSINWGIWLGLCCPSPSRVIMILAFNNLDLLNKDLSAMPLPRFFLCLITITSRFSAITEVKSLDPSSHTIIWSTNFLIAVFPRDNRINVADSLFSSCAAAVEIRREQSYVSSKWES